MNLHKINEQVINGEINALEAFIQLKKMVDVATKIMTEIKRDAVDEADKYQGKTFEAFGAKIEKRNGGGTWNYKHLDTWCKINDQKKVMEDLHKSAYRMGGNSIIDPNTGEIVQPAEWKPNADTLSIKIL